VPVGFEATGWAGENGASEAALPPKLVIHPRCAPPRKCWVVEFDDMK
jgi:hypothetical protein